MVKSPYPEALLRIWERYAIEDIRGNAQENAEILLSVLKKWRPSPFLETTVLNAGLGFQLILGS